MQPEYHQHEEFQQRTHTLHDIRSLGIDPYPPSFRPTHTAESIIQQYDSCTHSFEEAQVGITPHLLFSGRLVLFRAMGKNAFAHLQDETGRLQVVFNKETLHVTGLHQESTQDAMKFVEKKLDLGDIIGVEGHLFRTQKGELTLFVKQMTLLCKTLLPLPDKHSGLVDKGVRYRKRWLDLISHLDGITHFRKRSRILELIRHEFAKEDFLEVETPVLQNVYGGAQARPFVSHLHALDQSMFLRISLEIPLKKLLVGGLTRVYEMGKVFRNEGIDRTHNPEFTELEAYAAYWDYTDMMTFVENLFANIAIALHGTTKLCIQKEETTHDIDLKTPWIRMSMKESLLVYANINYDTLSKEEIYALLSQKGVTEKELHSLSKGLLLAKLFEEYVEHHLLQPHHIIDHPIETTPLCKPHRDPLLREEGFVERFETFIAGAEFCNSYTELNDPELQRSLLEKQAQQRLDGDEEANPLDEEFIEAICQGMPPAGGFGMGVDRLVMLLTNAESIKDVLLFPLMKSEEHSTP